MKKSDLVGAFTGADGVTITVTPEETQKHFGDMEIDKVFRISKHYDGGLTEIEVHSPEGVDAGGLVVVVSEDDSATIREGEYLAVYHDGDDFLACPIFSRDDDIVTDGDAVVFPVNISNGENDILAYGIEVGGEVVTAGLVMAGQLITGAAYEAYKEKLPHIETRISDLFDMPIDKMNSTIWTLTKSGSIDSKKIDMAAKKDRRRGNKIPLLYSVDFSSIEGVTISKQLTPYDERVYLACAALFNAGYETVSTQQIYSQMGYKGDAGGSDKAKINDSLTKMMKTSIKIDNQRESEVYNYQHFIYDSNLLPMERISAVVGGQVTDSAIHIFREPPAVTFARQRKQLTTIDVKLLNSPLSKTELNIKLENYLIRRIARIKKSGGKTSNKILFTTIYENVGIKKGKPRQRALPKIMKLLAHYKKCDYVKGYRIVSDGVEIFY